MTIADQVSLGVRRLMLLGLLAGCAAAAAAPESDAELDAQALQVLHTELARSFVLDKELQVDPALRAAADAMSAAHLARIGKLLPAWLQEERKVQLSKGAARHQNDLYFAIWAKLVNELALWQLEPGDADYERATLAALKSSPRVCDGAGDSRYSDFSSRMLRVQAMPAAQRTAALATERELLAHWGKVRTAVAPWPDPLPQEAAAALIKLPRTERTTLAVPPILAAKFMADRNTYSALHADIQCALHQWWLRESLLHGATPAAALNAFRYGTLITANARFAGTFDIPSPTDKPASDPAIPPYPKIALRFIVTGVTTMRVQLDAAGKPLQASVSERKIAVPGIRGVRPVAFEDSFDPVSVRHALARQHYDKPNDGAPFELQLVWTLDEPAATPAKPATGVGR